MTSNLDISTDFVMTSHPIKREMTMSSRFKPVLAGLTVCVTVMIAVGTYAQENLIPPTEVPSPFSVEPDPEGVEPTTNPTSELQTEQSKPDEQTPLTFEQIGAQIRANERLINHLFSTIPIGFANEQKAHMEKINSLRANNEKLLSELEAAAFKAYENDATRSPQVSQLVYNALLQKIDMKKQHDIYDPAGALEIADMMLNTGFNNDQESGPIAFKDVAYQAFRASFAIEDYERAGLMLEEIEARGIPLVPRLAKAVQDAKEKWQRELMIRRLEFNTDDLPRVKLETTEGEIIIELFENHASQTVGNFISLVEKKFYDDMDFFLVKPAQLAQTGCPEGDGTGDAGYKIPCECYREQIRHHFTGTVSMANDGRDTGGSQFFITHQRNGQYDGKYTAFGRVIEGMDVVYKLKFADPERRIAKPEPSKIIKATVIRKRDHPYAPSRVAKKLDDPAGETDPDQSLKTVQDVKSGG